MARAIELFQRTERLIGQPLAQRRAEFERSAAAIATKAATMGSYQSGAVVERTYQLCATELAACVCIIVGELIDVHKVLRASASASVRSVCKDWVASQVHEQVAWIGAPLARLPAAKVAPERVSVLANAKLHIEAAYAKIDQHFDDTAGNTVERVLFGSRRWVVRVWLTLRRAIGL